MALLVLGGGAGGAGAAEKDPQARRKGVQHRRAQVAAELDVLKASDAQLQRALDELDANVRGQESRAASTRQAADVAVRGAAEAREAERRTAAELDGLRRSMRKVAVNAYVAGPSEQLLAALDADSVTEIATRQHLLEFAMGHSGDLADALRAKGEDLAARRSAADRARKLALARRREADASLGAVRSARDNQQRVAASVDERVDRALAEAQSLASLDSQLAADITRRQAELARRVAAAPAARVEGAVRASRRVGGVTVTSVRGIVVSTQIAERLSDMLTAADGDGMSFGGAGYRDSSDQVRLRRAHCGSSEYATYEMSPSQCRPPTARPGSSMHEQGLAVDFTHNGRLISSRASPGFQWLARNARRFGFYNLPSEPWHWSVNGN